MHKFDFIADLRRATEPLPLLIRSVLLSPVAFELLRYVSLPAHWPHDILILKSLPHVETIDIHILCGRAIHRELPFTEIKHVKTVRFAFSDTYTVPEGYLQALTCVLELFEDVRSVEVYDGMGVNKGQYPYEDVLLRLFASLGPALEPHRDTLETLLFSAKFYQNGTWFEMIPDLSTFHALKTLKIPEQLINQYVRNVINGQPAAPGSTEGLMYVLPKLRMEFLPPKLEALVLDRCSGVIFRYLKTLVEHEDMLPELRRIDLFANCLEGLWDFKNHVDADGCWKGHYKGPYEGYWTPAEGTKIKFRAFQDFYRNTWVG